MDYKDIVKDFKSKDYKNVYLIYGKENYIIDNIVKECKNTMNEALIDFNIAILEGNECNKDNIINSTQTLPFMDEKRLVILKDFELIKSKKKSISDKDEEIIMNNIDNLPKTTVILFIAYGEIDKRKKIVKHIEKQGAICNCDKLKGSDLTKWAKSRFEKEKVRIDISEITYFLALEDYENKNSEKTLFDIENEILKIASFVGSGNSVNRQIIEELSSTKRENDIFKLIDCIGSSNAGMAIKVFKDMIVDGEPVLRILSMIGRQFRIMLQGKQLKSLGYTPNIIAQKLSLHPFVVTKAIAASNNFSNEELVSVLNEVMNIDYSIKNGLLKDQISVEILISKLCQKNN